MKASQKQNWCDFHVFYFPGGTGFFSPSAINSSAEGVSYMDEADWYRHSHKTVRLISGKLRVVLTSKVLGNTMHHVYMVMEYIEHELLGLQFCFTLL